jgi:hypothetical protein
VSVSLLAKWRLLQFIFADARLSQSGKIVAGVLLDCLNTGTGRCDPSIETMQARSGLGRRSVTRAISELRETEWISQKRRRGTATYSFNFADDDEPEAAHQRADDAPAMTCLNAPEMASLDAPRTAPLRETGNLESGKMKPGNVSPASGSRPRSRFSEPDLSAAFDEWWPHYPKRVDKDAARRGHTRVLKAGKATNAELIAGADRYAAQCAAVGTEARFIKGPERWLNAGCWADEPEARASNGASFPRRSGRDDYRAALADFGAKLNDSSGPVIEGEYCHGSG